MTLAKGGRHGKYIPFPEYIAIMNTCTQIEVVRQKLVFSINTIHTKLLTHNRTNILWVNSSLKGCVLRCTVEAEEGEAEAAEGEDAVVEVIREVALLDYHEERSAQHYLCCLH